MAVVRLRVRGGCRRAAVDAAGSSGGGRAAAGGRGHVCIVGRVVGQPGHQRTPAGRTGVHSGIRRRPLVVAAGLAAPRFCDRPALVVAAVSPGGPGGFAGADLQADGTHRADLAGDSAG